MTGQTLTDRFKLGTIRLTQVQPTLSLAKVEGTLLRPPQTGDENRDVRHGEYAECYEEDGASAEMGHMRPSREASEREGPLSIRSAPLGC